jgi:hypothetical protein
MELPQSMYVSFAWLQDTRRIHSVRANVYEVVITTHILNKSILKSYLQCNFQ